MDNGYSDDAGQSNEGQPSKRSFQLSKSQDNDSIMNNDIYELDSVGPPQNNNGSLFPEISYDLSVSGNPNNTWSDVRSSNKSAISIIDDAASSVCLDDIGEPLDRVAKTIYKAPVTGNKSVSNNIDGISSPSFRTSGSNAASFSGGGGGTFTDFDDYNRRTAAQVLADKKIERRNKRHLRRRLRQERQEVYFGNYFNNPNLESMATIGKTTLGNHEMAANSTLRVSYNVDHFNGHRQNENYNHQLNLMFAQNNDIRLNRGALDNYGLYSRDSNGLRVITSRASYLTDNIDDMTSSDGWRSDGDEPDFDDESLSSFSSFSDSTDDESVVGHRWFPRKGLKRRLMSRHTSSFAFAGAIGVSSMLAMGQALFASGPLGALLGFLIAGVIVYSVFMSYGEMVSFLPLHTGLPGVISRFVDPSMGIAIGFCYWFSNAIALPLELTAAAMMLTNYEELAEPDVAIVWIIVILVLVLMVNLCNASIYGEFQFIVSMVRTFLILALAIMLIVFNRTSIGPLDKPVGFRFWIYSKSDFASGLIYGPFRPILPIHVLYKDNTNQVDVWGIPGSVGRFLQVWQAIITASRAYMSSDIVFASVGEARNPRRSLARATKWIFWRIVAFYIVVILIFGVSIYAGDSNLIILGSLDKVEDSTLSDVNIGVMTSSIQTQHDFCSSNSSHYMNEEQVMGFNRIPWIVALQTFGMCTTAAGINAAFVIFAISAGSAQLYASSRTLYGLFRMHIDERKITKQQYYGANRQKRWFLTPGWCSASGVPTCAILLSFPFAFLAFLVMNTESFRVFNLLLDISSTASIIVWAGMALAFTRFYGAVKAQLAASKARDGEDQGADTQAAVCREDIGYPFRSPFQPYAAWFGLVGCTIICLTQGYLVFLRTNWELNTFVSNYISVLLFVIVYVGHKLFLSRGGPIMIPLSRLDLDSGRREMERAEWAEDRKYGFNFYEFVRSKWSVVTGTRYNHGRHRNSTDDDEERKKKKKKKKQKQKQKQKQKMQIIKQQQQQQQVEEGGNDIGTGETVILEEVPGVMLDMLGKGGFETETTTAVSSSRDGGDVRSR